MEFTEEEKGKIKKDIEKKYNKVAINPKGQFSYPTGRKALKLLKYKTEILEQLPDDIANSYCGSGNPFLSEEINKGDLVLEFGCGAGVDSIFASNLVGEGGKITGIDIVEKMLKKAEQNINSMNLKNIELKLSQGVDLGFSDESFDVIISNSVFNLIPDKKWLFKELYRCLKPGGRLMAVDQVFTGNSIKEHSKRVESWFQ